MVSTVGLWRHSFLGATILALVTLVAIVCALWVVQLALALWVTVRVPAVSALSAPVLATWPKLSIVVPARDEERRIEAALASKLGCGYPSLEVIAIDDRSSDGTRAIMERTARADPRLVVAQVESLPDGWLGKLNAMSRGLDRAKGEWVLFSDADVHVEPGTLERLIAYAEANEIDLFGVFPRMHSVGWLLDASCAGLVRLFALTGRTWSANDDRSHVGLGVGAFTLVRRKWLERTKALEVLKMEVADDVAIGALLKQSGARTRFLAGRGDVHLVFLDDLGALSRSADKGGGVFGFRLWLTALIAILPTTFDVLVPLAAIFHGGVAAVFGALTLTVATITHVILCAHFGLPLRGALVWPLGHPISGVFTFLAGYRAWRDQGVYWRRTFYPRRAIEEGQRIMLPSLRVRR